MPPHPILRSERPVPEAWICPSCGARDAAVVFTTRTVVYLLCRCCEHVWQVRTPPELVKPDAWTSVAFRITRRVMARRAAN